jgi:hypothetical protein
VIATYGLSDHNVEAAPSEASFEADFPHGRFYEYPGPHGVGINACTPALNDFLSQL